MIIQITYIALAVLAFIFFSASIAYFYTRDIRQVREDLRFIEGTFEDEFEEDYEEEGSGYQKVPEAEIPQDAQAPEESLHLPTDFLFPGNERSKVPNEKTKDSTDFLEDADSETAFLGEGDKTAFLEEPASDDKTAFLEPVSTSDKTAFLEEGSAESVQKTEFLDEALAEEGNKTSFLR